MRNFLILFVVFISVFFQNSFSQDSKDIREDIVVTNVEVPVRVFFKGETVTGLKQSDFVLYEGGKEQVINGFYEVTKVIDKESIELSSDRTSRFKPRYFVLVFRITSAPDELVGGLETLFSKTFRASDQLLIFLNNKTMFFKELTEKERILPILVKRIKGEALRAKFNFEQYFKKVIDSLNTSRLQSQLDKDYLTGMMVNDVISFLRNYLRIWREYKKKYLLPDMDNYYNFSKFLEKIDLEKWVISFYQFEKFPALKLSGKFMRDVRDLVGRLQGSGRSELQASSRIISKMLATIERELKVSDDFPTNEISRLFLKVNTTFHSLFFSKLSDTHSQDFAFKEISTDLENSLRELTKITGGELIVSNKLSKSVEKMVQEKDSYYMLTYSPVSNKRKGRIKVVAKKKGCKVVYDNNIRADYIEEYLKKKESEVTFIQIENSEFHEKKLRFKIAGIMHREIDGVKSGRARIHLLIKNKNGTILYDKSRELSAKKKEIELNIGMSWLKPGEYDLTIDVADMLTGRSAFEYKKIRVK